MGVLSFLRGSNGPDRTPDAVEPNLPPELLERYRQLPSRERRRLLREAEESATSSLEVDSTRDWQAERDAHIELELSGVYQRMRDAVKRELTRPGGW